MQGSQLALMLEASIRALPSFIAEKTDTRRVGQVKPN